MKTVACLYRHPIKGVGRETILKVDLVKGKTMPNDRLWAVMHSASKFETDAPEWVHCNNFIRGASSPQLQAVELVTNGDSYTLSHPGKVSLTFNPHNPDEHAQFIKWISILVSTSRPEPTQIVQAPDRGMTDSEFASVSIMTMASLDDLSRKIGQPVSEKRFRGNIWLDGATPWQEHDWVGKTIRIGTVELTVRERIRRCTATMVNTETGARDIEMLKHLETHFGHSNFGVVAEVIKSGTIRHNDIAEEI